MKTTRHNKYISPGISFLLGAVIYLFFAFVYPYHLYFQEQNQMFLFTLDYLQESISNPGGLCGYISSFLIQFYMHAWLGAAIISLLLVLSQRLVLKIFCLLDIPKLFDILTLIPSLLYWRLLCDENYQLTPLITLLFVLTAAIIYLSMPAKTIRIVYFITALILLYVIVGDIYWTFGLSILLFESMHFPPFSKSRLIVSLHSKLNVKEKRPIRLLLIVCTACLGSWLIYASTDEREEVEMKYDYYLRYGLWNRIIKQSQETLPKTPVEMAITNLSLAQTGRIGDWLFHYPENNPEMLFPPLSKDFSFAFATADIYYHLGMVNIAQRLTFESMESIPGARKSCRAIKRLAETNLINDQIVVARKYLKLLQHTVFYRLAATNELEDTYKIKSAYRPEWKEIQTVRPVTDFIFSGNDKTVILQSLVKDHPENRIACEYLVAYSLLTNDLDTFAKSLPLLKRWHSKRIPLHYQEALLLMEHLNGSARNSKPLPVDREIKNRFDQFMDIYRKTPDKESLKEFSGTYWYYYSLHK